MCAKSGTGQTKRSWGQGGGREAAGTLSAGNAVCQNVSLGGSLAALTTPEALAALRAVSPVIPL